MTKAEIKSRINDIPFEMLQPAVYAIERTNPVNAFTSNRAYIYRSTRGGYCTAIEIDFQTRATKENMMNVYHAILDQILCFHDITAVHAIDPDYTPAWYQEITEDTAEIVTREEYQRREDEFSARTDALCENVHIPAGSAACNNCPARDLCKWLYDHHPYPIQNPFDK